MHFVIEDSRGTELAQTATGLFDRSVITIGGLQYHYRRGLHRDLFTLMNAAKSEPVLETRLATNRSEVYPIRFRGHSLTYAMKRGQLIISDHAHVEALTVTGNRDSLVGHAMVGRADLGGDLPLIASVAFVLYAIIFLTS